MKTLDVGAKFDLLVLEDVYQKNKAQEIFEELKTLLSKNVLQSPEVAGSARYEDGSYKKQNKSLFLDLIYQSDYRRMSPILTYTQETLLGPEVADLMEKVNPAHGIFRLANHFSTLVSYYEKEDKYDFHHDQCAYSTLSYFFEEPKSFSGGEIVFSVNNSIVEIPIKNNMSIVFPSCYQHMVKPIMMDELNVGRGLGRFCISQFIGISAF